MNLEHPSTRLAILTVGLASTLVAAACPGEERVFRQRYELHAGPHLGGGRPKAKSADGLDTFQFDLPSRFRLIDSRVAEKNLGGMEEGNDGLKITPRGNGVTVFWRVRNGKTAPLSGRTAFLEMELKGVTDTPVRLSDDYRRRRTRFLKDFYFQGRVAGWVDSAGGEKTVNFGDQTIEMGMALMVFSTEIAVARKAGRDTAGAQRIVGQLLDGIDELDRKADEYFRGEEASGLDGFVVRDDITGAKDLRLGNRFAKANSDWQNPELENNSPSGDQLFGLLFGLFCVEKFSGDDALRQHARGIANRLFQYMQRTNFVLTLPDGRPVRRGSDMRWLASIGNGVTKATTGIDRFSDCRIDVLGVSSGLKAIAAFWDDPLTPRMIAGATGTSLELPFLRTKIDVNSFALHLLLTAVAIDRVWTIEEFEQVASASRHEMSTLLYCAGTTYLPRRFTETHLRELLEACPADGPSQESPSQTGWQHDNRWIRCTKVNEPNPGSRQYNGLDWLLLHNLAALVY